MEELNRIKDFAYYEKVIELQNYLNNAGEQLAWARDLETALDKISEIIIPKLADWFTIDIVNEGTVRLLKVSHKDNDYIKWAVLYREQNPIDLNNNYGIASVLKTGKSNFTPKVSYELIAEHITDPERLAVLEKMHMQSVISVPMKLKERITGAVTLISTSDGRYYDELDLRFSEDMANRIALTLENVRLNEEISRELIHRKKVEAQLQTVTESMPQKVFTTNSEGNIIYYNRQWEVFFGLELVEIERSTLLPFIHPDDVDRNVEVWKAAIFEGKSFQYEHRFLHKDGSYRWQLTRALPSKDEYQNIVGWIGTTTDIHDRKLEEERKDEFISIASHELKTPLTSLKAFNQLLLKTVSPADKSYPFIKKSSFQVQRLQNLIEDLLDVTKINSGKISYNRSEFSFKDLVEDVVESMQHTTLTHELIIERLENVVYTGDRIRLEQVISNFLSNAIKYSPNAEKVIVKSIMEDKHIVFSVTDFGIGIRKENLSQLFDRFYRVDNTSTKYQGLGLGLYISSEILKRHNGSFWIESEVEKGSTFYFRLPVEAIEEKAIISSAYYKDSQIEIKWDEQERILAVDWIGYQTLESVKKGCLMMLELLNNNRATKVLNDNRHVKGTWSEAAQWVGEEWFPLMEEAGLKYFAWIYSPGVFSQLSAEKSLEVKNGQVITKLFYLMDQGRIWLHSK